jgi:hypothetical protein
MARIKREEKRLSINKDGKGHGGSLQKKLEIATNR